MKEDRKQALSIYKAHPITSWIISMMFSLFASGIIFLCLLLDDLSGLSIFLIPLLILPSLFATILTHYFLNNDDGSVTFSKFFTYFCNYFRAPFRSSFRFFYSLFFTLIISFLAEIVFAFIFYGVCALIDANGISAAFNKIVEMFTNNSFPNETTNLETLLGSNYNIFMLFFNLLNLSTIFVSVCCFIYFISVSSLSIFSRIKAKRIEPLYINSLHARAFKNNKRFKKDYFSLNWPLYALLFIGFIGGVLLFVFKTNSTQILLLSGVGFSFILMGLYLPFYFPNMEVLYSKYQNDIKKANIIMAEDIINQINKNIKLSEEEKEILEKRINNEKQKEDDIDNRNDDSSNNIEK